MADYLKINPNTIQGENNIDKGNSRIKHDIKLRTDKKIAVLDDFSVGRNQNISHGGQVASILMSSQMATSKEGDTLYPLEGFYIKQSSSIVLQVAKHLETINENSDDYRAINLSQASTMSYEMINDFYQLRNGTINEKNISNYAKSLDDIIKQVSESNNWSIEEKQAILNKIGKKNSDPQYIESEFLKYQTSVEKFLNTANNVNKIMEQLEEKGVDIAVSAGNNSYALNVLGYNVKGVDTVTDSNPEGYKPNNSNSVTVKADGTHKVKGNFDKGYDINEDGIQDLKELPNGKETIKGTSFAVPEFLGKFLGYSL